MTHSRKIIMNNRGYMAPELSDGKEYAMFSLLSLTISFFHSDSLLNLIFMLLGVHYTI
jgi:hypothetical protein